MPTRAALVWSRGSMRTVQARIWLENRPAVRARNCTMPGAGGGSERVGMDIAVLIDAIVRQTTVLIAQLVTSAGGWAPLAHTANQVFVDLVRELKEQGLGNKVIADM